MEDTVVTNPEVLESIKSKIYEIRGVKVMLDFDLAKLYGVETKVLNQAVRRNLGRFPDDFMFELTNDEYNLLISNLRSQFVTSSWGGNRYKPYAFTEQGVAMLSSVLRSETAISVNIKIMRAFVATRHLLYNQGNTTIRLSKLEQDMQELREYMEDVFKDYNDINEDTRMQLELISITLAELQVKIKDTEEKQANKLPVLNNLDIDLAQYDTIFLGYPIWFGSYAPPVATLVKEIDFAGKTIIPFCTFGSGGLDASIKNLKAALPAAKILNGYGVRNARIAKAPAEVKRFLIESGYIAGEVEKLPEYSEQQPVTQAEIEIFNAACGDYKYPIGTPVTVGKRTTPSGTDYHYIVNSNTPNGNIAEVTVFVTVSNNPNEKPEFTEVVR